MATHTSPMEAATAAIQCSRLLDLAPTSEQTNALKEWQRISPNIILGLNAYRTDSVRPAPPLLRIFARLFFHGELDNIVYYISRDISSHGFTSLDDQGRLTITIDIEHRHSSRDTYRAGSVISTILHECVHAYFDRVVCIGYPSTPQCEALGCNIKEFDELAHVGNRGGHGLAWHDLALEVESLAGMMLGMEIRLGRDGAAELHIRTTEERFSRDVYRRLFPGRHVECWGQNGRIILVIRDEKEEERIEEKE
ncbi:hypothetical protein LTR78_003368 [Recurvomyces mirabilis]|uniref:SprT-like domain-containing protein n=1 Tax=Recurvomyces mirabilis TaxID=574656 RepID=A0AAE1C3B8_9PEZI|nr:hypothetical protein LTR78_003368 [Recurvomyces mirabilis]KAK5154596.1 hypothetical protein LTS14_006734 [Recurvomyces mirabilis]